MSGTEPTFPDQPQPVPPAEDDLMGDWGAAGVAMG